MIVFGILDTKRFPVKKFWICVKVREILFAKKMSKAVDVSLVISVLMMLSHCFNRSFVDVVLKDLKICL